MFLRIVLVLPTRLLLHPHIFLSLKLILVNGLSCLHIFACFWSVWSLLLVILLSRYLLRLCYFLSILRFTNPSLNKIIPLNLLLSLTLIIRSYLLMRSCFLIEKINRLIRLIFLYFHHPVIMGESAVMLLFWIYILFTIIHCSSR